MSRGPGAAQRYILDQVSRRDGELMPLSVLANLYAKERGVESTPHLRSSLRRAINRLADEGLVQAHEVFVPTRAYVTKGGEEFGNWRFMTCVGDPDLEVTDEVYRTAVQIAAFVGT